MILRAPGAACALAAIIASITFSASVRAEDDAGESAEADRRTIVVLGAGTSHEAEQRAGQTAGGAGVIGHEDYADKSAVSLRDALAFSPGVYVQPRFGQEMRLSIRGSGLSRGYHMRGLTLLQDGVPINLADDNGDFQELDPLFFDHLEVYRGANALRFGSGTLGGAINGVTPKGTDAPGLYLRADGGSFDTLRGFASIGGVSAPGDFWAAISADRSDGDREHARRDSLRFHGNLGLRLSDTVATRFYASVNRIDQELPGALDEATVLTRPRTGNFAGDQARDIDSLRLQNRTTFSFGDVRMAGGVFLNAKSLYHPIYQVLDQESLDRGVFARLDWARGPFELAFGGEVRFGKVVSRRYVNIAGKRGALTFDAEQSARTANVYGEVRFRPAEALTLIAGGIYADGYRRQRERFNSASESTEDVIGHADFSTFSPRFGVLFEPGPGVQIYGNYSRSAEFPGFIELAQASRFVPIRAQRAWTAEIGTRGRAGFASWDVSLYRADIRGELLQFNIGPDIPASTFNAGRTRHQGIEAALTLEPLPWLRLRQTYQYSDFRFRGDPLYGDNRLPVIPEHAYRAELRIGSEALHLSPNLEWVPQGAWADYTNTARPSGYALIGLTGGMTVREGIDLFLDARNILAEKAVGDISAAVVASPASVIYYPVERRAVYAGVRARF